MGAKHHRTCYASKHNKRAMRRHSRSDYPGLFMDAFLEKAKTFVDAPEGCGVPAAFKGGVFVRLVVYVSTEPPAFGTRFIHFENDDTVKEAIDWAVGCSS